MSFSLEQLQRLCVVGVHWHAGAEELARWSLGDDDRPGRLRRLASEVDAEEIVYLATCNRVELTVLARSGVALSEYRRRIFRALGAKVPAPGEAERALRGWVADGALEHLFLVASGLDSAQAGEREIRGQIRRTLQEALELGVAGNALEWVLRQALKTAEAVHRNSGLGRGRVSLAEIAVQQTLEHLARHCRGRRSGVAVVGVSPMTEQCAMRLSSEGHEVLVVNRTPARAVELAARLGCSACSLELFHAQPPPLDALILATGARQPVLCREQLERLRAVASARLLIVDLAVPPDVDHAAAEGLGMRLIAMDEVSRCAERSRQGRQQEIAEARVLVDQQFARARRLIGERSLGPVLAGLAERHRTTAHAVVERWLAEHSPQLGEEQVSALRAGAEALARRLTHLPVRGLRALASECGLETVQVFLEAGSPELLPHLFSPHPSSPEEREP